MAALAAILSLAAVPFSAHAAERVTLRTGFDVTCVRREALPDGHVRLYLAGNDNYMDVAASAITQSQMVSDPPKSSASPAASAADLMTFAGKRHNVDVDLLASVVKAESAGNAHAVSRTGAQGLMQLMPQTAATLGVRDSFEPSQNLNGGSAYLDQLLRRYHENLPLALAAYNAGPAAVDRYRGIPPFRETRLYVAKVIREFNRRVLLEQRRATAAGLP